MTSNGHKTETPGVLWMTCSQEFLDQLRAEIKAEVKEQLIRELSVDHRLELDRWLNTDDAAAYCSMPVSRLNALVSQGELVPDGKDGQRNKYRMDSLDQWLRNGGGKRDRSK